MTGFVLFDYGVGNLHSLKKALDAAGAPRTTITTDPAVLVDADVAVLPGVGAFGHVMQSLAGAEDGLRARHRDGRPILGVCIGKQILYEGSAESPSAPGLGILPGKVVRLPPEAGKVPHMGWNPIRLVASDDPLLSDAASQHVYYVHSYAAPVGDATCATTTYGMTFSAAVRAGNTVGFQFHPEKSSRVGQGILRRTVSALVEAAR